MHISQEGIALIKKFEGFCARPYTCPAGKLTIGYGHVIRTGEVLYKVTPEQAEALLREDIAWAEAFINRKVTVPLNQGQFDALVSFVYNIGCQAFEKSYLLRLLNAGNTEESAGQFTRWIFAGGRPLAGLIARRRAEKAMFLGINAI